MSKDKAVTSLMIHQQVVALLCLGEDSCIEERTRNYLPVCFSSFNSYYAALDLLLHSCNYYGNGGGTCSTKWQWYCNFTCVFGIAWCRTKNTLLHFPSSIVTNTIVSCRRFKAICRYEIVMCMLLRCCCWGALVKWWSDVIVDDKCYFQSTLLGPTRSSTFGPSSALSRTP